MEISEYIAKSREHNISDDEIKQRLLDAGWTEQAVYEALGYKEQLEVPVPPPTPHDNIGHHPHPHTPAGDHAPHQPLAVVENLSPRGFEFKIYAVSLLASLISIIVLVNSAIYGESGAVPFPVTVLLVTGPLTLYLFGRLRKAERADPKVYTDASRRKSVQAIQLITFLIVIIHTISFLYGFISGSYGDSSTSSYSDYSYDSDKSALKDTLSWLVSVIISGLIFVYYWQQEHKLIR